MEKIKLLLVDDEVVILDALSRIITKEYPNIEILSANDGIKALEIIADYPPHIMVLDLGMMKMGGFEVLQHLAQKNQIIPTLVMSAHNIDDAMDLMQKVSDQPDLEFLSKPLEKNVFFEAFERLIQKAKLKHSN